MSENSREITDDPDLYWRVGDGFCCIDNLPREEWEAIKAAVDTWYDEKGGDG